MHDLKGKGRKRNQYLFSLLFVWFFFFFNVKLDSEQVIVKSKVVVMTISITPLNARWRQQVATASVQDYPPYPPAWTKTVNQPFRIEVTYRLMSLSDPQFGTRFK